MTKSTQCRCTEELDFLSFKIHLLAAISGLQLIVVLVWAVYAMCIRVFKKTKAEKKAEKEWLADKEWEAGVKRMEHQLEQNRKMRKAKKAEAAKEAKRVGDSKYWRDQITKAQLSANISSLPTILDSHSDS